MKRLLDFKGTNVSRVLQSRRTLINVSCVKAIRHECLFKSIILEAFERHVQVSIIDPAY